MRSSVSGDIADYVVIVADLALLNQEGKAEQPYGPRMINTIANQNPNMPVLILAGMTQNNRPAVPQAVNFPDAYRIFLDACQFPGTRFRWSG